MNHLLFIIFIAAILGWGSLGVILTKISPYTSHLFGLLFFYISLFIALSPTFTIISYLIRICLNKKEIYFSHINTSFRQGTLLAIIVCICFFFQSLRVLTWWNGSLVLFLALFIELYFMSKDI